MMEVNENKPLIKRNDSTAAEPITKEHNFMCNLFVIFVLYTLEGMPLGLISTVQVILQNKSKTTFSDQVNKTADYKHMYRNIF